MAAVESTANIAPALCSQFQEACLKGDYATALSIQDRLMPLHDAIFVETSPGPVKYAASLLGKCDDYCRPPIVPIAESSKTAVRDAMVSVGLLN